MKQTLNYFQRLHQQTDFELILKSKVISEKWLAIHCRTNNIRACRLGVVVSKRLFPLASKRNRIKRQVREAFRISNCNPQISLDIVVRLKKTVLEEEVADFRRTLLRLLWKVLKTHNDATISTDY